MKNQTVLRICSPGQRSLPCGWFACILPCQKKRLLRLWASSFYALELLVGTHYREATRARSDAEFISKMEGGLQELEESTYWFELLVEAEIVEEVLLVDLVKEADELMAVMTTIVKNTKRK